MSVIVEAWAWQQNVGGGTTRKIIFVKLAQNADDDGWSWWGQGRIAADCQTTRQTVNEHIKALVGMGLLYVEPQTKKGRGRFTNRYRILGPWAQPDVGSADTGVGADVGEDDRPDVGEDDTNSKKTLEPSEQKPGTPPTPPTITPLGGGRFKVASSTDPRRSHTVDLRIPSCTCQDRTPGPRRDCKHMAAALAEQGNLQTATERALIDAVWDALVECYGAPTNRQAGDRGLAVSEVVEMLRLEGVEAAPENWAAEVKTRHAALVKAWGVERTTLHGFVKNWNLAGRATGSVKPPEKLDDEFSRFDD